MAPDEHLPHTYPPIVRKSGVVMLIVGVAILSMMMLAASFFGYSGNADLLNKIFYFFVALAVSGGTILVLNNLGLANNLAQRK